MVSTSNENRVVLRSAADDDTNLSYIVGIGWISGLSITSGKYNDAPGMIAFSILDLLVSKVSGLSIVHNM